MIGILISLKLEQFIKAQLISFYGLLRNISMPPHALFYTDGGQLVWAVFSLNIVLTLYPHSKVSGSLMCRLSAIEKATEPCCSNISFPGRF